MALNGSWQDLKARFEQALGIPEDDPAGLWIVIWRLFIGHPWYRAELGRCARQALRDCLAAQDWLEDVQHDAILLLARSFRHARDLHRDAARIDEHFPGWMATIIRRDCLQAIRRLHAQHGRTVELQDRDVPVDEQQAMDAQVGVWLTLEKLEEPERSVLLLHLRGMTVVEIAKSLGLEYTTAYRALKRGREQMRGWF